MNLRDVKKDIEYVLSAFVEDCSICAAVNNKASQKQIAALMEEAVDLYNELRDKVNVKKIEGSKKAYFNNLRKEILERTDALYSKLSETVAKGVSAVEEAPEEKPAAKKAPAKKAEPAPKAEKAAPAEKPAAKKPAAKAEAAPAKKAAPAAKKEAAAPAAEKKPAAKKTAVKAEAAPAKKAPAKKAAPAAKKEAAAPAKKAPAKKKTAEKAE